MKNKNFLNLILSVFCFTLIFSCKQEPISDLDKNYQLIQNRNSDESCLSGLAVEGVSTNECSPGMYSVENGVLKFLNSAEFLKTIDFLSCADSNTKNSWLNNLPITSAHDVYEEFMDHFCDESITSEQLDSLLTDYEGKIRYNWIDEADIEIEPLYNTYSRFRNMNGHFLIGSQIESEVQSVRISVFEEDWEKLQQIISTPGFPTDSVSYEGDTTFVIFRESSVNYGPPQCCPNKNHEFFHYPPADRRRLESSYTWVDESRVFRNSGGWFADPILSFSIKANLRKRNDLGIWSCHKRHFKFHSVIDWWVVPTGKIEKEDLHYGVENSAWTCRVSGLVGKFTSSRIGPFESRPEKIVCAYKIDHTTHIHEELSSPPEQSFTISCFELNRQICKICPPGYYWDKLNCYSHICAYKTFIWNNGYYYHPYPFGPGGDPCPLGGTFNGSHCGVGSVPAGWEGEAFIYNDCFYVRPHYP